jgi:hypothetical protein
VFVDFYANPTVIGDARIHPPFTTRLAHWLLLHKRAAIVVGVLLVIGIKLLLQRSSRSRSESAFTTDNEASAVRPRWQGWDGWVIGIFLTILGALWLLQLSEGPLLNRSLFAGAGAGSDVVLPVALATTIFLAGAAFLHMLARNIRSASPKRAESWKRTLGRSVVPAIAVALLIRTFILAPFWSATDATAPEIPRGSLVLVWKLSRTFAEGELIAYAENGRVNIGRIAKPSQGAVFVKRNNSEPTSVLHSAIVGKVISVVWRGTRQASMPAFIEKAAALNRTGPVFPYTISGRTTVGKPLEVGGFADVIVTNHGGGPRHSEVLPIVRGAKVTKITDNGPSISNDRLVELELTQAEVDLTKLHAYRHSFYFARFDAPLSSSIEASPITSPLRGGDDSPASIAAAQKLGIAAATKDIQAGNFRILGYGAITQIVDPPVDEETGYRIQYVAGSFLRNAFRAECDAYNFAMREHHQKHQPTNLKQLTTPQNP